ncbi:unnamed protein product [Clonostachys solani]|uniref:Ubiquitin-like protease family profile domain-containing protein n=1 Tax=Clonostachys solani TaxID=160281 RepID=A0A9N9W8E6_9HYPO|nr:unnamed protein product [Clonostachys solani]
MYSQNLDLDAFQTRSPMIFNLFSKLTAFLQNDEVNPLDISENTNSQPPPLDSTSMASHQTVTGQGHAPPAAHPESNNAPPPGPVLRVAIKGAVQLQQRGPQHLFPGEAVRQGRSGAPNAELFVLRKQPLDQENETMRQLKTGEQIEPFPDPFCESPISGEPRERLEQTYGRLEKLQTEYMSPPQLQNSEWHDDEAWLEHIKVMHNLLSKMVRNAADMSAWLEGIELHHLLKIATYGMEEDVAVLEPFTIFSDGHKALLRNKFTEFGTRKGLYMAKPPFYKFGDDEPQVDMQIEKVKAEIAGKRWLVAPVNLQTEQQALHWSITIFDRLTSQLYIFDSLRNYSNDAARFQATATGWARFWDRMGLPYDFQFFVPLVTPQCKSWECGYLSAVWAFLTLRLNSNHVAENPNVQILEINLGTRDWEWHNYPQPSLLIADWTGYEARTQNTPDALERAYDLLFLIICNELGIPEWYSQADRITEMISCQHTNRSWVPRYEHPLCDAGAHQERVDLHVTTYRINGRRINAVPDQSERIPLGPDVHRLICSRADHQSYREAGAQTIAGPGLITQQPVVNEQEVRNGDKNADDDKDEGSENPTTRRVVKPKTKPKAQPKSRAGATSSKKVEAPPAPAPVRTRSGRRVKAPDRFEPEPEPEPVAPKPKAAPKASEAKPAKKKKNAAAKPDPRRDDAKGGATKPTGAKSKKRTLDETEPKASKNSTQPASSEMPKSKKRKVAAPPAASKPAKKQKKDTRAKS